MSNKTYGKVPVLQQTKLEIWINPEILYWLKKKCLKHQRIEEVILGILEKESKIPEVVPRVVGVDNMGNSSPTSETIYVGNANHWTIEGLTQRGCLI